jgi:hypothetical protein
VFNECHESLQQSFYDSMPEINFSHQVAGRIKITSSPGFAAAVLLLQLFLVTKPEATIVETG